MVKAAASEPASVAAAIEFFVMLNSFPVERCECRRGTTPRRSETVEPAHLGFFVRAGARVTPVTLMC
jgi:hypothetical protein